MLPSSDARTAASVFYRVDPRLFRDADGDGVGDLPGLAAGLGYLRWLGVDAIWPVFDAIPPDPAFDGLLPVARPEGIHLADGRRWRRLTAEAHRFGMRVVIDGWADACRVRRDGGRALAEEPASRTAPRRSARTDLSLRTAFGNGIDAVWAGDGWALPPVVREWASTSRTGASVAERTVVASAPATIRALLPSPVILDGSAPGALAAALHVAMGGSASAQTTIWTLLHGPAPRAAGAVNPGLERALALLLLCLPGVAAIASGDELGLIDGAPAGPADPGTSNAPKWPERAAMAWDERAGGGFAAWPWRPVGEPTAPPVSRQRRDPDSLLAFYRRAIGLRRTAALGSGAVVPIAGDGGVVAVLREDRAERFLVALNLGDDVAAAPIGPPQRGHVALATRRRREGSRAQREVRLDPGEAVVVRLDP